MKRAVQKTKYFVLGALLATMGLWGLAVTLPHAFNSGDEIKSAEMNANFQALKNAVDALEAKLSAVQASKKALSSKTGQLGYALVFRNGAVNSVYSFMSNGNTPSVTKLPGNGLYKVTFPGFYLPGGHVQLTTFVQTSAEQDNICAIKTWGANYINVQCVDSDAGNGIPQDTGFTILVLK